MSAAPSRYGPEVLDERFAGPDLDAGVWTAAYLPTWNSYAEVALAPTLAYDSAVMADRETGGAIPEDLARSVGQPALVLVGGESAPPMLEVGTRLAGLLPAGTLRVLEGTEHVADPAVLSPVVADFLAG